MTKYLSATPESGQNFYHNFHDKGKVVMLNLLKFRERAEYSNLEQTKPDEVNSGEEAYNYYLQKTLPELKKAGSKIIYYGKSNSFLIGPESEKWDAILVAEHKSVKDFMELAQSENYLKNAGHRTAGLEDSRLLPSTEFKSEI
ncbi:DUF1330 domain-containing protein [Wenyingzhuangia sp. IMCC45533]